MTVVTRELRAVRCSRCGRLCLISASPAARLLIHYARRHPRQYAALRPHLAAIIVGNRAAW